jgi:hypothetical protein
MLAFRVRRGGIGVLSPPQAEETKDLSCGPIHQAAHIFPVLIVT